jgi:hypothetical protein
MQRQMRQSCRPKRQRYEFKSEKQVPRRPERGLARDDNPDWIVSKGSMDFAPLSRLTCQFRALAASVMAQGHSKAPA